MKTQISRWSHDPKKRRSGIYQQQGRMITDADLNELVELFKQRVDDALGEMVGSGLPRTGTSPVGLVADGPQLRRGSLYVDGIRAQLESSSGTTPFALNQQADFPGAPAWAGGSPKVLYADVWEWPYTALQDAGLLDPGLHGADTCTRTQTLAQVKLGAVLADVLDDTKNPKKGDATLTLDIRQASSAADPCDPCATEIALNGRVGNYLFRIEVHDVQGPANAPTEITLKWSSENGAEAHAQEDVPAEFKRGDWIYEFYNDTTERHLGVHLGGFTAQRGVFKIGWPVVASDVPAKAQYPYVRRWDGYAVLVRSGSGTWSVKVVASALQAKDKDRAFELLAVGNTPTHGHYTIDTKLVAYLSGLQLTLDLEGRKFVAGDYWLATVREDAENADRVQQAGEYSETGTAPAIVRHYLPLGVTHHYLVLAQVNAAGTVQPTTDAETRRLSFPPLTNLTADRVGYSPDAKAARWTDIIDDGSPHPLNVQSAIDVLIEKLESSDIGYSLFTCVGVSTSVRQLITWPAGPLTVKSVLDTVLCQLDGSRLPYDAVAGTDTVKDKLVALDTNKVNRAGDTMTGSLMISTGGLHVGGGSDPGHGNCVIEGDLTVKGTTTTINTTQVKIEDNIITVNAAEAGGATAATAGLEVERATPSTQAQLLWREPESRWTLGVAGQTRQVSVSSSNTTNYALLAEYGRIGQLESGTFGDGWGKWAALGTPNIGYLPTSSNYYGLKVQWDSDAVVFGLKDYGADRKDAIIAWGDNSNDNLRFLRPNDIDAMIITGAGNVGIGMEPYTQFSLTGPIGFANGATPLTYVYQSGVNNPTRALFAHSPAWPGYGLFYRDTDDTMIFQQSDSLPALSVDLGQRRVGIRTADPAVELDVVGAIRGTTVQGASWSYAASITFSSSITASSTAWVELTHYRRTVTTPALSNLLITLHIPFAGNDTAGTRSRIRLAFDSANVSDSTKYNTQAWELHEVTLTGLVSGVTAGTHTIRVYAAVSGGTLNIPHYNTGANEATLVPAIFANLSLIGFY